MIVIGGKIEIYFLLGVYLLSDYRWISVLSPIKPLIEDDTAAECSTPLPPASSLDLISG